MCLKLATLWWTTWLRSRPQAHNNNTTFRFFNRSYYAITHTNLKETLRDLLTELFPQRDYIGCFTTVTVPEVCPHVSMKDIRDQLTHLQHLVTETAYISTNCKQEQNGMVEEIFHYIWYTVFIVKHKKRSDNNNMHSQIHTDLTDRSHTRALHKQLQWIHTHYRYLVYRFIQSYIHEYWLQH